MFLLICPGKLPRINRKLFDSVNVDFFVSREKSLAAYFQFAPDGLGSRFACKDWGASHFD